ASFAPQRRGTPVLHHGGAPFFGIVLFASTVTPALTALPAITVAVIGEVLRVRSWIYYMLGGGASLAAVPLLVTPSSADLSAVATSQYMAIFLAAYIGCSPAPGPEHHPVTQVVFGDRNLHVTPSNRRTEHDEQIPSRPGAGCRVLEPSSRQG